MAWTYSGDPSTSLKDAVRFEIGDTDATDPILQDEEIAYVIANRTVGGVNPNVYLVAAEAADDVSAKFARQVNKNVGRLRVNAENKAIHYKTLANDLRKKAPVAWYSGGLTNTDKSMLPQDQDAVQPAFSKGMMRGQATTPGRVFPPRVG